MCTLAGPRDQNTVIQDAAVNTQRPLAPPSSLSLSAPQFSSSLCHHRQSSSPRYPHPRQRSRSRHRTSRTSRRTNVLNNRPPASPSGSGFQACPTMVSPVGALACHAAIGGATAFTILYPVGATAQARCWRPHKSHVHRTAGDTEDRCQRRTHTRHLVTNEQEHLALGHVESFLQRPLKFKEFAVR